MNILIANDDGIHAPGIEKLAAIAAKFGKVWVTAPANQCSGMSHRLTIFRNLPIEEVEFPIPVEAAWKIGGTPADCVKLAITTLMPVKPDVVLSGINKGHNGGLDIAYSGTIGAAMEALINDVPAIAVSNDFDSDFSIIDEYLEGILGDLLAQPPSLTEIWNVNFPVGSCKGIRRNVRIAPMGMYESFYTALTLEDGAKAMKPDANRLTLDRAPEGTDLHAVLDGYIAIGKVKCVVKQ